jgi:hypothetical protein
MEYSLICLRSTDPTGWVWAWGNFQFSQKRNIKYKGGAKGSVTANEFRNIKKKPNALHQVNRKMS